MMHNPLFLVLAVIFSSLVIPSVTGAKASSSFSVDLIHRDSPTSPFYNASLTSTEILRKNALRSMSRLKHFRSLIDQSAIRSALIPSGGIYLMKLSFGTPPVEYFAIADTGSDLIWIQCLPCGQCYPQGSPPFDPRASSTYKEIPCGSDTCQALPRKQCTNTNDCQYSYGYGDNSFTVGALSTDTLTFDSSNGKITAFATSIFGCGHNNQGKFRSPTAGLVGLGGGPLSLVSQISTRIDNRFSYRLVPRTSSSSSKLLFGQEAVISRPGAVSTPLITKTPPTFYFLSLEGVSIGDKTAQPDSSHRNIIIDSGTTLTLLESNFYNSLETIVKDTIGADPVQDPSGTYRLCYGAETNINVPEMVFHFSGADLRLQPVNTFRINADLMSMLIVPSDSLSIFGNYAQINFRLEYDLQKRTASFAPTDCTKQ
ncbi:Detected protein of unknown function [Hibiscus syriacus]|uniref:Peptidase A1 domain-containing protein n=2 Tax=Hibiscus syriacus TaxID=106335 RepID=A0A6A2YE50_HIBSY|nr:Detected protein of unknown function [Hibiscus syriacus]